MFACRLFPNDLGGSLQVDGLGQRGQQLIGGLLLVENRLEELSVHRAPEKRSPGAEGSIDCNLVMLDPLSRSNQVDIADGGVGCIFDAVLSFRNESINGLTGDDFGVASGIVKQRLHLGDMTLSLLQVI